MKKIINNVVGGRYYVLEQVGTGGFSKVYRVKDLKSGNEYALKEYITSDPSNQKKLLEGMERELKKLDHDYENEPSSIGSMLTDNEYRK